MTWFWSNLDHVGELMLVHLALSVPAIMLSFVISIPLGWVAHRYAWSRGVLLSVAAVLYAIPSLALFVSLPAITGFGVRSPLNLVIALTIYGVAVMMRTAADAFDSVSRDVRQSATALGYSPAGRFWGVELPLAGPVLLSGLRVVIVSTVSLATVGAVIGVPSLGSLFTDGFQRGIQAEIVTGIVATIVLAVVLDLAAVLLGRLLLPWTTAPKVRRRGRMPRAGASIDQAAPGRAPGAGGVA
ncbi:ABC transporter permease [Agromyces sp. NPDC058110]|uniref:ABC transporter permease n=1 Tax=Agromyces sp. NPDC058110 TaxID=3346345 RepID=UPI0036DF80E3